MVKVKHKTGEVDQWLPQTPSNNILWFAGQDQFESFRLRLIDLFLDIEVEMTPSNAIVAYISQTLMPKEEPI